jgi:hypothetical protein
LGQFQKLQESQVEWKINRVTRQVFTASLNDFGQALNLCGQELTIVGQACDRVVAKYKRKRSLIIELQTLKGDIERSLDARFQTIIQAQQKIKSVQGFTTAPEGISLLSKGESMNI